jgi:hypothetical protein
MRTLFCWLLLIGSAQASTLAWDYDTTLGPIPTTATVQRGPASAGPFTDLATIASLPSSYPEPVVPTGWTAVYYRISNAGGLSNVTGYVLPVATTTTDTRVDALLLRMTAAESKLAGVCRAAKAAGGSSTSLAGRLRTQIPCP